MTDKETLEHFKKDYENGHYEDFSYLLDFAEAQFHKAQELDDLLTQVKYDKAIHESNARKMLELEKENEKYRESLEFLNDSYSDTCLSDDEYLDLLKEELNEVLGGK